MIALLTYLYYSLWEVEIDKELWAFMSAIEVALELYFLMSWLAIYQPWKK